MSADIIKMLINQNQQLSQRHHQLTKRRRRIHSITHMLILGRSLLDILMLLRNIPTPQITKEISQLDMD